jgi:hypothetical protein
LVQFYLFFSLSAFYFKTAALTSHTVFFVVSVIALIHLTVALTWFSGQRPLSVSFRADSAKLLQTFFCHRFVAEGSPALIL